MKFINIIYGPFGILLFVLVGMTISMHLFPGDDSRKLLGMLPGFLLMIVAIVKSSAKK